MKILHSADWHILLHKKKVPYKWQVNRFKTFFSKLIELEKQCEVHIIAGDIFDKKPEPDEVCLFLSYINSVTIPTYIIPGNHEATRKGETFLEHFTQENAIKNSNVHLITKNKRVQEGSAYFQFFPYGEMQIDNLPVIQHEKDILVTHIRGEVPPHITPEYDFEKLRPWKLILLGDLHFAHKYLDYPAYYPGSPLNVTFDRDEKRQYGVNIITLIADSYFKYKVDFIDLKLPKLIRKTIKVSGEMKKDTVNHVLYEVTGSIDELSKIENSELLDKKIATQPVEDSKLDLKNKSLIEELELYLKFIKIKNTEQVIKEFKDLNVTI
jgi:DNA repair exonuclease SbcCD nuclease subunit